MDWTLDLREVEDLNRKAEVDRWKPVYPRPRGRRGRENRTQAREAGLLTREICARVLCVTETSVDRYRRIGKLRYTNSPEYGRIFLAEDVAALRAQLSGSPSSEAKRDVARMLAASPPPKLRKPKRTKESAPEIIGPVTLERRAILGREETEEELHADCKRIAEKLFLPPLDPFDPLT